MARPTKKEQETISRRNKLIMMALSWGYFPAEVARIFRLPRNTVTVVKRAYSQHSRA